MANGGNGNDWKEWSQHVLIEIKRLTSGQEYIKDSLSTIDRTLTEQHSQLAEHMRRTEALEEIATDFKVRIDDLEAEKIGKDAVRKYKTTVIITSAKILGAAAALLGLIQAIPHVLTWLIH